MKWLLDKADTDAPLTADEALAVLEAPDDEMDTILEAATRVRRRHFGDKANLCSIVNAKSGHCTEDCSFCAQSAHHSAGAETHPLLTVDEIVAAYEEGSKLPVTHFGIVTSGGALSEGEVNRICQAVSSRQDGPVSFCASLGMLSEELLVKLRGAGLTRYHHNLETAESFFPSICTTHTYADRVETVRAAVRAGLEVCSGGIFGLGETKEQRVELAAALRDLEVDSIPLNFLVAIPDTPVAARSPLSPGDIIRTVAMFRLTAPTAHIKVCAGREHHLGDLESSIFAAGATGMMIGGYLTVAGRPVDGDLAMIAQAGMST